MADPAKRKEIIRKMQKIIYDKAYVIPMYARLSVRAATKRVTRPEARPNDRPNLTDHYAWDVTSYSKVRMMNFEFEMGSTPSPTLAIPNLAIS